MREMFSWSKSPMNSGFSKFAVRLANEMIDLVREDPCDLVFDLADAARLDREFAFAVQGEQAAVALDLDFARQSGHGDDRVIRLW